MKINVLRRRNFFARCTTDVNCPIVLESVRSICSHSDGIYARRKNSYSTKKTARHGTAKSERYSTTGQKSYMLEEEAMIFS
jgi:hypothetical protein